MADKNCKGDLTTVLSPNKGLSLHTIPTNHARAIPLNTGLSIDPCITTKDQCEVYEEYVAPGCTPVVGASCGEETMSCTTPKTCTTAVQPYYTTVPTCPQTQTKYINQYSFATSIKNQAAFNMPECNGSATVIFPGVSSIALYSKVWAYGIGYLTITGLNPATCTLTLRNDCDEVCETGTQASPGTQIPACTEFVVTAPVCSASSGGLITAYPYLAAQFTAPASGSCIDISVTNVNGLSVNKNVQISGGTYRIDEVKSGTLITICNDGSGVTPGTIVNAQDTSGNYITPVVLIDSNPCTNTGLFSGKLIVCNNNIQVPLLGSNNGQVPVYDSSTQEVNFRDLLIPVGDCTVLTVCLTLDPTLPSGTAYLVTVQDTSIFGVGDPVVIAGRSFTVDSIIDGTQMRLVPDLDPTAIETYDVGQTVCDADCCTVINANLAANVLVGSAATSAAVTPGSTGAPGSGAVSGNTATLVIPNTSTTKNMVVTFNTHWRLSGDLSGAVNESGQIRFRPDYQVDTGAVGTTVAPVNPTSLYNLDNRYLINAAGGDTQVANTDSRADVFVIVPGNEIRITARSTVNLFGGDVGTDFAYSVLEAKIDAMGVAL